MVESIQLIQVILSLAGSLAAAIPLAIILVRKIMALAEAKKWPELVTYLLSLMEKAEKAYETGVERKSAVLNTYSITHLEATEEHLKTISSLIDTICESSKTINATVVSKTDTA